MYRLATRRIRSLASPRSRRRRRRRSGRGVSRARSTVEWACNSWEHLLFFFRSRRESFSGTQQFAHRRPQATNAPAVDTEELCRCEACFCGGGGTPSPVEERAKKKVVRSACWLRRLSSPPPRPATPVRVGCACFFEVFGGWAGSYVLIGYKERSEREGGREGVERGEEVVRRGVGDGNGRQEGGGRLVHRLIGWF